MQHVQHQIQKPDKAPPGEMALNASLEERAAPRFTLLIRSAKLLVGDRQFACLLRDISVSGASVRLFHPLPEGSRYAIELDNGMIMAADLVWHEGNAAGFHFHVPADVDDIMQGVYHFPKRDLRFAIEHSVEVHAGGEMCEARLTNLSRQGGKISCDLPLAKDQLVRIKGRGLPEIETRVRWKGAAEEEGQCGCEYGLVFDTTFSLAQLANVLHGLQKV
jgi:hypothetical protein